MIGLLFALLGFGYQVGVRGAPPLASLSWVAGLLFWWYVATTAMLGVLALLCLVFGGIAALVAETPSAGAEAKGVWLWGIAILVKLVVSQPLFLLGSYVLKLGVSPTAVDRNRAAVGGALLGVAMVWRAMTWGKKEKS